MAFDKNLVAIGGVIAIGLIAIYLGQFNLASVALGILGGILLPLSGGSNAKAESV